MKRFVHLSSLSEKQDLHMYVFMTSETSVTRRVHRHKGKLVLLTQSGTQFTRNSYNARTVNEILWNEVRRNGSNYPRFRFLSKETLFLTTCLLYKNMFWKYTINIDVYCLGFPLLKVFTVNTLYLSCSHLAYIKYIITVYLNGSHFSLYFFAVYLLWLALNVFGIFMPKK